MSDPEPTHTQASAPAVPHVLLGMVDTGIRVSLGQTDYVTVGFRANCLVVVMDIRNGGVTGWPNEAALSSLASLGAVAITSPHAKTGGSTISLRTSAFPFKPQPGGATLKSLVSPARVFDR